MDVLPWRDGFVAGNFAGSSAVFDQPGLEREEDRPSRCLAGARSPDGNQLAMACQEDRVVVLTAATGGGIHRLTVRHAREIASVLPDGPLLLVGGYPMGLAVYGIADGRARLIADLETAGTPYRIVKHGGRYWIACGTAGIYTVAAEGLSWKLTSISIRKCPPGESGAGKEAN